MMVLIGGERVTFWKKVTLSPPITPSYPSKTLNKYFEMGNAECNRKFNERLLIHRGGGPPSLAREGKEVKTFWGYVAVDLSHVNVTQQ